MNNRLSKYKCPGAKRLMLEALELKDNTEDYCAQPIEDNLFEWHFTVRGPPDTAFDGGYYHGRLSFPTDYPMKPPSIILLTPNGRFDTNVKICLSISGFHPETWQPSWSVRTVLLALIAFMPTKGNKAIGSLDFSDAERRRFAVASRSWSCETCGLIKNLLVQPNGSSERKACITSHDDTNNNNLNNSNNIGQDKNSDSINESASDANNSSIQPDNKLPCSSDAEDGKPRASEKPPVSSSVAGQTALKLRNGSSETMVQEEDDNSNDEDINNNNPQHTNDGQLPIEANTTSPPSQAAAATTPHRRQLSSSNHPPMILKAILVLLSILILRRVVMMIQPS